MFAKHNAVFYYKGRKKGSNPIIEKWKDNIHIIANQAYRSLFGAFLCFSLAFLLPYFGWMAIPYSLVLMMLVSGTASYDWQKWINLGVGLPEIDPNEKPTYELTLWGKSWEIPKLSFGKRRKPISMICWITLIGFVAYLVSHMNVM